MTTEERAVLPGIAGGGQSGAGLEVTDVVAGYKKMAVLHGVTLRAERGEVVGILGPNGAGKSTLVRVLVGLLSPSAGSVTWRGARIDGKGPSEVARLGVGLVPEGRRLYLGMTVEENLLVGGVVLGRRAAAEQLKRVYATLERLHTLRRRHTGSLSGGEQQLCAIGRAVMCRPSLLIIDELSFGLSAAAVRVALDALGAVIQEEHRPTVLIVDQDLGVLRSIAKRGYFMEEGQIAAQGLLDELVELDLIRKLYFSVDAEASESESDKIPETETR